MTNPPNTSAPPATAPKPLSPPIKRGTEIAVVTPTGVATAKVIQPRATAHGGFTVQVEHDEGNKQPHSRFTLHPNEEGTKWAHGWDGADADALRTAHALKK